MERKLVNKVLQVGGMTCSGCEIRIENALKKMEGIVNVKAIYSSSNVYVTYDAAAVGFDAICDAVEGLDYEVRNRPARSLPASKGNERTGDRLPINQLLGILIIIFAAYVIIKNTIGFNFVPQVSQDMGYGLLFIVGLLTSVHCVAMCGGICLSQCVSYKQAEGGTGRFSKLKPSILYNSGRVVSYTVLGGIAGAVGSVVSFSGTAKGIVAIISGIFMVIMGLNMLNIFPWLRRLNPRMPKIFANKLHNGSGRYGPFYVGVLNGLMPCGPLQTMQIYALGTGSAFAGALSMFVFSIGTLPLMLGFGAVSSLLSGKFTHKMMKISAVLVMVLGVVMMNRGLSLSGFSLPDTVFASSDSSNVATIDGDVQIVTTQLESDRYEPLIVQKGIPVKWTIKADPEDINGCNETITIPEFDESYNLVPGDNLIEFVPEETGNIVYTCWMGMISSSIKVVDDITNVSQDDISQIEADTAAGGIGGIGGGGCCGAIPPGFADGRIPTDDIQIAKVENEQQEVTITVNNNGYSPAAVIVQQGLPVKIKFDAEQLNGCNTYVMFPEFNGGLDLAAQTETPPLPADRDFTFQCSMNMLHGYVKVVEDINNVDLAAVKKEIEEYNPSPGSSGGGSAGIGGGCCG